MSTSKNEVPRKSSQDPEPNTEQPPSRFAIWPVVGLGVLLLAVILSELLRQP